MRKVMIVAAALIALAAACQTDEQVVFGDSLAGQSRSVGRDDGVTWNVANGADLAYWERGVDAAIVRRPAVIVLALGSGDVLEGGWTRADRNLWIDKIDDAHRGGVCVAGVLPWFTDAADDRYPGIRAEIDEARADLVQMRFDVLVDWKEVVTRHPGYLGDDGIHLAGQDAQRARYDLVTGAANAC